LCKAGITEEGAVVWQVIGAVVVPFAGIVITNEGVQVVSDGRAPYTGVTVAAPLLLKPFIAVNVSVVDPNWPGAVTGMVVGLAVTVNVGGGFTVSVMALDVEPV
jgi:hypothetical protein